MKSMLSGVVLLLVSASTSFGVTPSRPKTFSIPTIDVSGESDRRVILAEGTPDIYQGHVHTLLMPDGKTMQAVWTIGHGGACGPMKRSEDGGLTWSGLLDTPKDWQNVSNCPTIHRLLAPDGKERLFVFAGSEKMVQTYSEDGGKTWSPMQKNGLDCVVAPISVEPIQNGNKYLMWYHTGKDGKDRSPLVIWQSESEDGGLTWKNARMICAVDDADPCEPACIRSPDGKQLLLFIRENKRKFNSLYCTSDDEGQTWSEAKELPGSLTGDRHLPHYAADGRLVVVMRDMAKGPTQGHFVAWIGTYDDIVQGREGQYRVKLLHSHAGYDCGYPGLERLPDGTMVATTYIKYRPGPEKNSIVSVRFKLQEIDAKAGVQTEAKGPGVDGNSSMHKNDDGTVKDKQFLQAQVKNLSTDGASSKSLNLVQQKLDSSNYVVGTQTFCPHYQFTEQPKLIETAQAILDMGSNIIKFGVGPHLYYEHDGDSLRNTKLPHPDVHNLKELFEKEPAHRQVLEMPFAYYLIWTYPFKGYIENHYSDPFSKPLSAETAKLEYDEIYALTAYLLKTYSGINKTFFLGHWEGDWLILGKFDDQVELTQNKIDNMIAWLNVRQKAVDDARRDTPHDQVQVYLYTEVNLVQKAMLGKKTITNDVLPKTQVDYVSYSSYDSTLIPGGEIHRDLPKALDYIESKLPPKSGISGKRVFVGEYGFPEKRFGAVEQEAKSRQVMRTGIEWGSPFVLYWEMYNNDYTGGEEQGFWLINDKGQKQPAYFTHEQYYRAMRQYVADFRRQNGREPTEAEFRQKALDILK